MSYNHFVRLEKLNNIIETQTNQKPKQNKNDIINKFNQLKKVSPIDAGLPKSHLEFLKD